MLTSRDKKLLVSKIANLPVESPTRRMVPSLLKERVVMWNKKEEEDDEEDVAVTSLTEVESRSTIEPSLPTLSSRSIERDGDEIDKMTGEGVISLITALPNEFFPNSDPDISRPSSR